MRYAKRDAKGNILGHYEPTDEQVEAQEIWTHKVRDSADARKKDRASTKAALKAPKGMKLLCVEEDAMDETGAHDLYVFGTDKIEFVDAEAVQEMTPRVGFEASKEVKEAVSSPATPV